MPAGLKFFVVETLLNLFLQNDTLLLWPFEEGSQYFLYDESRHLATLQDDPLHAHRASYSNAARITTYLRPGVEQFHGGVKGTFEVTGGRANILYPTFSF